MARHIAAGAIIALLAASATGAAVIQPEALAVPHGTAEPDVLEGTTWHLDWFDEPTEYAVAVATFEEVPAPTLVPLVPVARAEAGGGGPVAPPPPAPPVDPLTIMLDRLVALEGEWVRPVWDCIAWMESRHRQYTDGPTRDRGFLQIIDFWWYGGFARSGHPELDRVDPYDPLNQANGAHVIWERNGGRWRGQWASARSCGVG